MLVLVAFPAAVFAKPKVAVAALEGDSDGKVTEVVAEAAADHAKVTGPAQVTRAMEALSISDTRSPRAMKKLRARLEVDAVIRGKVERDGNKKRLELTIAGRGKKPATFDLPFKTATAKSFRKELREELAKRIAAATEGDARDEDTDDDDQPRKKLTDDDQPKKKLTDEDEPKKKHSDEDEPKKKHTDDDQPKKKLTDEDEPKKKRSDDEQPKKKVADDERPRRKQTDDDRPKKRVADDDSTRTRKRSDDDDDDRRPRKKKRRHGDSGDEVERHPVTQAALWVDAGGGGARRTLTYDTTGVGNGTPPPSVGTASISGEIEGEVYPGSFESLDGAGAGFGLAGSFGKTFGLSIAVPGTTNSTPIKAGHYSIGARYRFVFGASSFAVGVSYWRQYYIADRSSLAMPGDLDMPDVEYSAVAPGAVAKLAATPTVGVFLALDVPLMMSTGAITTSASYGQASTLAFAFNGGVDVALATNYGLRFGAVFDQVGFSFTATPGTKAAARGVSGATDRITGVTATFALIY